MNSKKEYRELCNIDESIPLFSQAWWLDATAGDASWDVILYKDKNKNIIGSLPFQFKKKLFFKIITSPRLTQTLGPWIKTDHSQKYAKKLSTEKQIITSLYKQLPKYDLYQQNWHPNYINWLPAYWLGYKQTTNYTYVIDALSDLDSIWKNFENSTRTEIKKAINRFNLSVTIEDNIEEFIRLNRLVFKRQNMQPPYSDEYVRNLDKACKKRNCRAIFFARDDNNIAHAAEYIVWDKNRVYDLMGAADPDLRKSGATSLCMWEAIKFTHSKSKIFDLEGSMIEPIEKLFRAFGAKQVPYFKITKTNSNLLKLYNLIK
ncbi:GNAT family N-acetyltransferase [Xenorhabdus griffiniae]|uniref:GNAT family N-acetyltransferase n=2 Tax=Xenorhabdus griffiniae TaxID=351672 RepID=A0ABY9XHN7_9GAMM|nr:GNAT family N-acetyltransferase [Xenorhabdus griffiniae]WMV72409.1 GNAT family N-acetyltransferase [Xenorhabdus griffiniae]WNH02087.1 GNAT family N-acetyltransferase [Xenorhabdus griffiniae]